MSFANSIMSTMHWQLSNAPSLCSRVGGGPYVLAGLRAKILANRHTSPLYDIKRYTRPLEDAYKRMWHI